jgi:Domain of unknown function (DUF397)
MERLDDLRWRTSSYSGNGGNCVEVASSRPGTVAVRDSEDKPGPALGFTSTAWTAFVQAIKHGEFDL